MTLAGWLRACARKLNLTQGHRPPRRPTFRPRVEGLEDRSVPTTFNVTNTLDDGSAGSLRWAINQANAHPNDPLGPDAIAFNFGGGTQTIRPLSVLPPITDPVLVDGYTQPGAQANTLGVGDNAVLTVVLDGSQTAPTVVPGSGYGESTYGLLVTAGNSTVQGLQVQGFGVGVHVLGAGATADTVSGNYFNTNGTQSLGGGISNQVGVLVEDASGNTVGGTAPAARNLVAVTDYGVLVGTGHDFPMSGNVVAGNYIGLNAAGSGSLTGASISGSAGVWVLNASSTTVGGSDPGAGNVVAGPWSSGVEVDQNGTIASAGNVVTGNYVGTNATGTAAATGPAVNRGIGMGGGDGMLISRNLVSGCGSGIDASGPDSQVLNNLVGTDITGSLPIPNRAGISVGGGATAAGNTVAFNTDYGVSVGTGSTVTNNIITTNGGVGVEVDGDSAGPGTNTQTNVTVSANTIRNNGGAGVWVVGDATFGYASGARVEGNSISGNGLAGILLGAVSVTDGPDSFDGWVPVPPYTNTPGGPHAGDNHLQNYPVLSAAQAGATTAVFGALNSNPNTTFTIDFYASAAFPAAGHEQGERWLGSVTVTTDAQGNASFLAPLGTATAAGEAITATATSPTGDTSAFSAAVAAQGAGSGVTVTVQTTTPDEAHAVISAANALNPATTPTSTLVVDLGGQTIQDTTINVPPQVTLQFVNGTFIGGSPALVVSSGTVIVRDSTFSNATAAPTILVTGGSLTLRNDVIQESTGFGGSAIKITGGTADLGTTSDPGHNTLNVNGAGELIHNTGGAPVSAIGNTFKLNGTVLTDPFAVEDLIFHALDAGGGGLVTYDAGNVYVTAASGSVQRGIDAVVAGGIVHVQPGPYPRFNFGNKLVTVSYQNGPSLGLQSDPLHPGQVLLSVIGTAGDDTIRVHSADNDPDTIRVRFKDEELGDLKVRGTFATPIDRIAVYGLAGDDTITVDPDLTIPAWLFGGGGDDRLKGGSGSNVLVGGDGDDLLVGGSSRDILIGGAGADRLVGDAADDILIAGGTAFDDNEFALSLVLAEWTSDRSYSERVANLQGAGSGTSYTNRFNGNVFLQADVTVFDDGAKDTLTGDTGRDWFWVNLDIGTKDKITDLSANEFATDLDFIYGT